MGKGARSREAAESLRRPGTGRRQRERNPSQFAALTPSGVHVSVRSQSHPTFADRHIGPDADAVATMLKTIGVGSLDELADKALPAGILDALSADGVAPGLDQLPPAATEDEALAELRAMADANTVAVSMIGQGYFDTLTPPVLRRNILENPAWYTAYTPVPAGDQPGPARGAAELPDDGRRPDRSRGRQRLDARRGHRRRRGDDADAPGRHAARRTGWPSTPTCTARPRRCWPPAPSRWASRSSPPTCARACPTASSSG